MHVITKYDSSSSVSCMLLFMSFQRWRSWETQYSSNDTVLENIPFNLSPSLVSRDTQKEAALIQSSMQRELRLSVLLVECSRRPLIPSLVICDPVSYGLPSSTITVPSFCAQNYRQKTRVQHRLLIHCIRWVWKYTLVVDIIHERGICKY